MVSDRLRAVIAARDAKKVELENANKEIKNAEMLDAKDTFENARNNYLVSIENLNATPGTVSTAVNKSKGLVHKTWSWMMKG